MKAISLWQPWASLIASGAKEIETRSWATSYRGPILIHAAKHLVKRELIDLADMPSYQAATGERPAAQTYEYLKRLPRGFIIAVADLVDCRRVERYLKEDLDEIKPSAAGFFTERDLGNYMPGRYGWLLSNVRAITPIPYKGEQGMFEVPESVLLEVARYD